MSVSSVWMLSAVSLPGGIVPQIVSQDIDPGIEELLEGSSGDVDPSFGAVAEQRPVLGFETTAIGSALGLCGIGGLAIAATTTFWFIKVLQGGTRATGANNMSLTLSKAMIVPRRLQVGHKPAATIGYDVFALSTDGVTAPLATATGATLPTIPAVNELYCLGPVTINAVPATSLQEFQFDPGIKDLTIGADGNAYPTFSGILSRDPKLTFKSLDLPLLHTLGGGTASSLAVTTWKAYLRRVASGGTRVADGTANHVKITGTTGLLKPEKQGGQHRREFMSDYCLYPLYDGTNAIATLTTSIAIT